MSQIVRISDFTKPGRFEISVNSDTRDGLDERIDFVQTNILNEMLGCELATLLEADLDGDGVPATARFTAIYDAFCQNIGSLDLRFCEEYFNYWSTNVEFKYTFLGERQVTSDGIKRMLQGYTFFDQVKDMPTLRTTVGVKKNSAENSTDQRLASMGISKFWNDATSTYGAIQAFIVDDIATYPEFDGVSKSFLSII